MGKQRDLLENRFESLYAAPRMPWIWTNLDKIGAIITFVAAFCTFIAATWKKHKKVAVWTGSVTLIGSLLSLIASFSSTRSQAAFQQKVVDSQRAILENAGKIDRQVSDASTELSGLQSKLGDEKDAVDRLTGHVNRGTKQVMGQLYRGSRVSLRRQDSFFVEIPVEETDRGLGVAWDASLSDPLSSTFSRLRGIAEAPQDPHEFSSYLARLLQCYSSELIFDVANPPVTFSASAGHVAATGAAPLLVPEPEDYTIEDWLSLTDTLPLHYDSVIPRDTWLPKVSQFPRGTQLAFTTGPAIGTYGFVMKRAPDYSLILTISGYKLGEGVLPQGFTPLKSHRTKQFFVYSFQIRTLFNWTGDRDQGAQYQTWADAIVADLRKKLTVPAASDTSSPR